MVELVDVGVFKLVGVVEDVKNVEAVEDVEDTKLSRAVEEAAGVSVVLRVDEGSAEFSPVLIGVI